MAPGNSGILNVRVRFPDPPDVVFHETARSLASALSRLHLAWRPGPDEPLSSAGEPVDPESAGRTTRWEPGREFTVEWPALAWAGGERSRLRFQFRPLDGGTELEIEWGGWSGFLGGRGPGEFAAWFAEEVGAPLVAASSTDRFADWLTDRVARRPSGITSAKIYRDPIFHRPNFRAIFEELRLSPADRLVEIGCGGGAFLKEALATGCRADAIDHSEAMIRVASEQNRAAIETGRLTIVQGDAGRLPFPDGAYTCAVMTGVFQFLPDPRQTLREVHRVLAAGGRLVVFAGSAALKGTPAAPEPMASRLRFYENDELVSLAREAGFSEARVKHPDLGRFAREEGVPNEALPLFEGTSGAGQLLVARK